MRTTNSINTTARQEAAGGHESIAPAGVAFDRVKRVIDIAGGCLGLVLTTPLLVVCALWVRLMSGGPALYRQWRVGRDGWLFRLYKLRTMVNDAEQDGTPRFASSGDPRIIPGCAWMRKSHVDELPQLWNVIRGQMSLVGPRPERPEMIEDMRSSLSDIDLRTKGRPGLTGLAQVSNGYTNDLEGARKKLAYDLKYLRGASLRNDLGLLFRTIPKLWDQTAL